MSSKSSISGFSMMHDASEMESANKEDLSEFCAVNLVEEDVVIPTAANGLDVVGKFRNFDGFLSVKKVGNNLQEQIETKPPKAGNARTPKDGQSSFEHQNLLIAPGPQKVYAIPMNKTSQQHEAMAGIAEKGQGIAMVANGLPICAKTLPDVQKPNEVHISAKDEDEMSGKFSGSFIDDSVRLFSAMSQHLDETELSDGTVCDFEIRGKVREESKDDLIRALTARLLSKDQKLDESAERIKQLELELGKAKIGVVGAQEESKYEEEDLQTAEMLDKFANQIENLKLELMNGAQKLQEAETKAIEEITMKDAHIKKLEKQVKANKKYKQKMDAMMEQFYKELQELVKEHEEYVEGMKKAMDNSAANLATLEQKCQALEANKENLANGKSSNAVQLKLDEVQKLSANKDKDLQRMEERIAALEVAVFEANAEIEALQAELVEAKDELERTEIAMSFKDEDLQYFQSRLSELAEYEKPATIIMDFYPIDNIKTSNADNFFANFYRWIRPIIGLAANEILAITASRTPMKDCYIRKAGMNGQVFIYFRNLRSAIKFQRGTDGKILWIHVAGEAHDETIKPRSRFSHKYEKIPKKNDKGYENSLVCIPPADFEWEY